MIPALRWEVMRTVLMFHNCEGQSHKTVSTDHNFWRERRAEADLNRGPSAYQPNALLLGQTGVHPLTVDLPGILAVRENRKESTVQQNLSRLSEAL